MREEIIAVLEDIYEAKDLLEINDLLGLTSAFDLEDLRDTLGQLVSEYVVYQTKKDRYILLKNCPSLKIGKLSLNKKGFGFILLDLEDDLYISKENLNGATHEDIVLAEVIKNGVKREGRILKILKRDLHDLVGQINIVDDRIFLDLDDDKKDLKVELTKESARGCVPGHKVVVTLIKELGKKKYLGRVKTIIGHKDDPGVDILSIAYKYQIDPTFPSSVQKELEMIPEEVSVTELKGRKDYTNIVTFTIDGEHTKDIDDAISLSYDGTYYTLGVHIADVSHYVKENTALGDEAYKRATSNYLADTVIPMLPHQLSNGICSLNEGVLRLTMSCVMKIDKSGKVVDYDIGPSYIKSHKKMTYPAVNDIIMRNIVAPGYEPFVEVLNQMHDLAHILRREKESRGYIDFDLDEAEVVQDEFGKAIDIIRREREDAEKLIEDFMIAANECVASHVYHMELPFLYRVHGIPNSEKIDDFVNLVKIMGYQLQTNVSSMTPKTMQKLLLELSDKPEFTVLSSMLLRSMKKAEYSKDNIGHFGLASDAYTHFTSPIRRFPDLTVHRILKRYFVDQDMRVGTIDYFNQTLVEIASHSSEREVAAQNAERDVLDMKMAEYMENHIGEEYDGVISSVTSFGFFVELPNLIEGLVHVNELKGDYYNYVPESLALIGNNTKKTYRVGDKVHIRVISANKETAMIDFVVVEEKKDARNKE